MVPIRQTMPYDAIPCHMIPYDTIATIDYPFGLVGMGAEGGRAEIRSPITLQMSAEQYPRDHIPDVPIGCSCHT